MSDWHQLGKNPPYDGPTWRCKSGHEHRGKRPDGSPCTYKKRAKAKKQEVTNYAKLMRTRGDRAQPAKVTGVVRGGLPGLGKKR